MAKQNLNSIEKALHILMAFPPENDTMGTVEISKKLGLHKATASRILLVLTQKGLLRQDPETKKFSLGSAALDIGRAVLDSISGDIASIARYHIDQLRDELGETVVLEQFMVERTVVTHVAEGLHRVRFARGVGDHLPINASVGAKAILAFLDPEVAHDLIFAHDDFENLTPNTIIDPNRLFDQLGDIRKKGYATDHEETEYGISAVGVPVFNYEDLPVAAVVVVGMTEKINLEMEIILERLLKTARKISFSLMQG